MREAISIININVPNVNIFEFHQMNRILYISIFVISLNFQPLLLHPIRPYMASMQPLTIMMAIFLGYLWTVCHIFNLRSC